MEFRFDFFFRIFMDLIFYTVNFAFFKILYLHTSDIGGWNESQTMIFVASYIVVDALNMTLFNNNTWLFPMLVNQGDLDYYLVRPISSFFLISFREFAFNSFVNLIMAFGLLIYTLSSYPEDFSIWQYFLFVILIINSTWLFHLTRMLFLLPVFWTHSGRGFESLYWNLTKFAERPYGIYHGWLRGILLTALPFSVVSSFPVEILFNDNPYYFLSWSLIIGFTYTQLVLWIWRCGLHSYSSASS